METEITMIDYKLPKNKITANQAKLISIKHKEQKMNEMFEYNLNLVYDKISHSAESGYNSTSHFMCDSFYFSEAIVKKIESILIQDGYIVYGSPGSSGGYGFSISW